MVKSGTILQTISYLTFSQQQSSQILIAIKKLSKVFLVGYGDFSTAKFCSTNPFLLESFFSSRVLYMKILTDFPRYIMKCSGENVILRGIFHVVTGFPLHFMLYRGNLDCFSIRVAGLWCQKNKFKFLGLSLVQLPRYENYNFLLFLIVNIYFQIFY